MVGKDDRHYKKMPAKRFGVFPSHGILAIYLNIEYTMNSRPITQDIVNAVTPISSVAE